ncbi:hypothetical protein VE03_10186 [Pseudogymnoascus sp. 23342-1-I1]|nr:hypothetical protein VE03_10186 [Pseudogymnoascus sp. 23342-1-I1]
MRFNLMVFKYLQVVALQKHPDLAKPTIVEPVETTLDGPARTSDKRRLSDTDDRMAKRLKIEEVDLVDAEDEATYVMRKYDAGLMKQQQQAELQTPLKLAATECAICLDQPKEMTITHCGHMFCLECINAALNTSNSRMCPICRTRIGMTTKDGGQPRTGIFEMKMKIVTRKPEL